MGKRDSSIEILRIFLMFLIVVHHGITHGLGIVSFATWSESELLLPSNEIPMMFFVNSLCICAVNCFIFISGYYSIKISSKKLRSLIFILLFYSILLNVIPAFCEGHYKDAIKNTLFLSHSPYWFVIDYIFVMLLSPLLNNMENLSKKYMRLIIGGLLLMSCYFGFVWGNNVNSSGYTLIQFITIYSIGRYIRINKISISRRNSCIIYLLSAIINTIIMIIFYDLSLEVLCWKMTYYNNPLIIASSIGLFFIFKSFHINSVLINKFSSSAIAIYLIQSSNSISSWYYSEVSNLYKSLSNMNLNPYIMGGGILLIISVLSFVIITVSLIFEQFRKSITFSLRNIFSRYV